MSRRTKRRRQQLTLLSGGILLGYILMTGLLWTTGSYVENRELTLGNLIWAGVIMAPFAAIVVWGLIIDRR
jgi:hypothetical protein